MKVEQIKWIQNEGWLARSETLNKKSQLILAFGDRFLLMDAQPYEELRKFYPEGHIIVASTSGNIYGTTVNDDSIIVTAIMLEKPGEIKIQTVNIKDVENSFAAGETLGRKMPRDGLVHAFLISDGHLVNGSELIKGVLKNLPHSVAITGGMAGDGDRFEKTLVGINGPPKEGEIVLIGFYSQYLKFGFGSVGGWDPFGVERKITRSRENILYELDGKSALELYKMYLGDQAKELPSSALLFPLAIRPDKKSSPLVRTILSINEKDKSMIFAGDIPQGWYAQLMKANFDRLVDGAYQAASSSYQMLGSSQPHLAILISCVGRRIVLGPRTEEEIEVVNDLIGKHAVIAGFYSYGEIAPTAATTNCELHNQTMTITTISEE